MEQDMNIALHTPPEALTTSPGIIRRFAGPGVAEFGVYLTRTASSVVTCVGTAESPEDVIDRVGAAVEARMSPEQLEGAHAKAQAIIDGLGVGPRKPE